MSHRCFFFFTYNYKQFEATDNGSGSLLIVVASVMMTFEHEKISVYVKEEAKWNKQ